MHLFLIHLGRFSLTLITDEVPEIINFYIALARVFVCQSPILILCQYKKHLVMCLLSRDSVLDTSLEREYSCLLRWVLLRVPEGGEASRRTRVETHLKMNIVA